MLSPNLGAAHGKPGLSANRAMDLGVWELGPDQVICGYLLMPTTVSFLKYEI